MHACVSYLQRHPAAIEEAAEKLARRAPESSKAAALLETFIVKYLTVPDQASTQPAGRQTSEHHTGDFMLTFDPIHRDKRLIIADRDGHGTMRSKYIFHIASDDEFRLSRGEVLFVLPREPSENANSTHVVCNRHRDVGELLQGLRSTPLQEIYNKLQLCYFLVRSLTLLR
jgi:hypothetical protein